MNKEIKENLKELSRGNTGKNLIKLLESVKNAIADIRTPLKIRPEVSNEVRLGVCEAIDLFMLEDLKVMRGEVEMPDPDEML